jgi:hypothetical protein
MTTGILPHCVMPGTQVGTMGSEGVSQGGRPELWRFHPLAGGLTGLCG